mmetsp:Transcript_5586/g.9098  ORF Transcript_5586/g.9098 Transcript_5586/m.9098 type:complete len:145 (-) Transcript_5586:428-862(-)
MFKEAVSFLRLDAYARMRRHSLSPSLVTALVALYRAASFPKMADLVPLVYSACMIKSILLSIRLGAWTFRKLECWRARAKFVRREVRKVVPEAIRRSDKIFGCAEKLFRCGQKKGYLFSRKGFGWRERTQDARCKNRMCERRLC